MTYQEAKRLLPPDSAISSCFGNPGIGGYSEFWRTPDGRRFELKNGDYLDIRPFTWTVEEC